MHCLRIGADSYQCEGGIIGMIECQDHAVSKIEAPIAHLSVMDRSSAGSVLKKC